MEKLEIELKNAYKTLANNMRALQQKYSKIEKFMNSDATYEEKFKVSQEFDFEWKELIQLRKDSIETIEKIGTSKERNNIISTNNDVKKEYDSYLWNEEEVEYIYPLAKGAVSVFLRDDVNTNEL